MRSGAAGAISLQLRIHRTLAVTPSPLEHFGEDACDGRLPTGRSCRLTGTVMAHVAHRARSRAHAARLLDDDLENSSSGASVRASAGAKATDDPPNARARRRGPHSATLRHPTSRCALLFRP